MKLPEGWATATVEELAGVDGLVSDGDWVETKDQNPAGEVRLTQLADVGECEFRDRSAKFMMRAVADRLRCTYLQAGDALVARMPDPIGRACIFPGLNQPAVTAVDVMIWRTDGVLAEAEWFVRWINSPAIRRAMVDGAGGTTRQRIAGGRIKKLELPLPPLPEQRRIVAKLDALNARLARAQAELGRVPVLADHMRNQALQAAFDGTLFGNSNQSWQTVPFSEAGEIASNLVDPSTIADLPHIAPNHIRSGRPVLLPYTTIRDDGVTSGKHRFFSGQIIYSKIRPYLRKVVMVDFDGGCSADMYPINPRCHSRYLLYWMLSPQFTWLATRHEGRTVLPKINQNALNSIPTPLAPPKEQERIADALDTIFARADRLEAEAARAIALLNRLVAAILAKALRGELVPQDPNDEPASALLARIRAQRTALPSARRGRRSASTIKA